VGSRHGGAWRFRVGKGVVGVNYCQGRVAPGIGSRFSHFHVSKRYFN
jgi:hypothetical protein